MSESDRETKKRTNYSTYRMRCAQLERELAHARSQIPADKCTATVEYLLRSADTFIRAACALTGVTTLGSDDAAIGRQEG